MCYFFYLLVWTALSKLNSRDDEIIVMGARKTSQKTPKNFEVIKPNANVDCFRKHHHALLLLFLFFVALEWNRFSPQNYTRRLHMNIWKINIARNRQVIVMRLILNIQYCRGNCADLEHRKSGWWYKNCEWVSLNGYKDAPYWYTGFYAKVTMSIQCDEKQFTTMEPNVENWFVSLNVMVL